MARTRLGIGVAILLLFGSAASAQTRVVVRACVADVKNVCGNVQPGGGRMGACIKSHFGELSANCQTVVAKAAPVAKACKSDTTQLCGGTKPGRLRIAACMKANFSKVSEPCKNAVSKVLAGQR
jgi:hypothetical protein